MRATVFQSYIPNSCSRARARARNIRELSQSGGRARSARSKNPFLHITRGRAVGSAAVENHEKKEANWSSQPAHVHYALLYDRALLSTFHLVVFRRLGFSLPLFPSLFYGEYTSGQRQRAADRWKKSKRETERDEKIDGEEREVQRDAEEREARNGNHEKRQRIISIIDPDGRTHALAHAECRASVCAALRFIAAPLTGGLRPSKGCACGYVHNTVHRRMHVGPWMRRRARWPRERETPRARARAAARVCVCASPSTWREWRRRYNDPRRGSKLRGRTDDRSSWHLHALKSMTSTKTREA